MKMRFVTLGIVGLLVLEGLAEEADYYRQFAEAVAPGHEDFILSSSLLNTNNREPVITNAPVSFSKFCESGELFGVRLGMRMSEVVAAWGKPRGAYSYCYFGPLLWYGSGRSFGDVSLAFKGNRLVVIAIHGRTAKSLNFDNGLKGEMGRSDWERVLGPPSFEQPDLRSPILCYRENGFRTDVMLTDGLVSISVRLEQEAKKEERREQGGAANRSQPSESRAKSMSSAAGSGR
jgi:hypothetical protein